MFAIFCARHERRLIDEGRVRCPLRKREVEVDLCAACGWARGMDAQAEVPFVRCRAELVQVLPDTLLVPR